MPIGTAHGRLEERLGGWPSYPAAHERGGTVLTRGSTNRTLALAGSAAFAFALALGPGAGSAPAQIIPTTTTPPPPPDDSTTTTTPPEETTTTTVPEETTTTTAVAPETTATTAAPRTTTTRSGPTTTAFVPPSGVPATTVAPPAEEVLDADLGKLPLFVAISLLGFIVAVAIVATQWIRTRR